MKAFFYRILGFSGHDFKHVSILWFMQYLYRILLMLGWTFIVSLFLSREGVAHLPILFLINAILLMLGSLLYSTLLNRFSAKHLFYLSIFLSLVFLWVAYYLFERNLRFSFAFLVFIEAFFLVQIQILFSGFQEDLLTPLQGERLFSIIESGETVGGITAGILLYFFAGSFSVMAFFPLWAGFLILMFLVSIFLFREIKKMDFTLSHAAHKTSFFGFQKAFTFLSESKFVSGLFFIVLLYWIFTNILEFHFTLAVYSNIQSQVLTAGSGLEHALIHQLGGLQILLGTGALISHIFLGRRLFHTLGIVTSMLLFPVMLLLSIAPAILFPGFLMAVLIRYNASLTGVFYRNGYHSTFYVLPPEIREYIREFFEGFARPLGALLGTSLLVLVQYFSPENYLIFVLNLILFIVVFSLFVILIRLQKPYTEQASHALFQSEDAHYRLDAIEVLSQKGHQNTFSLYMKVLKKFSDDPILQEKILQIFIKNPDIQSLDILFHCLSSQYLRIRSYALAALSVLLKSRIRLLTLNSFTKFHLLKQLKLYFEREENAFLRSQFFQVLSKVNAYESLSFLLEHLDTGSPAVQASVLRSLSNIHDESLILYIDPYLHSEDILVQEAALFTLHQFPKYKDEFYGLILNRLMSDSEELQLSALRLISDLQLRDFLKRLIHLFHNSIGRIHHFSAVALASLGYTPVVENLLIYMTTPDIFSPEEISWIYSVCHPRFLKLLEKKSFLLLHSVFPEVLTHLSETDLGEYSMADRYRLRVLFFIVGDFQKAIYIDCHAQSGDNVVDILFFHYPFTLSSYE